MEERCIKNPILLVGNPNTGKTTLFNKITSSDEHVGNWHGVTVEGKAKRFVHNENEYVLVDLPGVYSLHALSYEEQVAIDYIISHKDCKVINICDVNNLERNLFLTLCLLEQGFDVVLAINSTLKNPMCKVNVEKLTRELGIDVVLVNAQSGEGVDKLLDIFENRIQRNAKNLNADMYKDANEKYKKIKQILKKSTERTKEVYGKSKLDKVLLNRAFAPFIFLGIMALVFYLTFFLIGSPLSSLLQYMLDNTFGKYIGGLFSAIFGEKSWIYCLVSEALIGGIGSVLSFLPQVVLLFFFLAILEESGYLSRVAFVFDDLLSKIGLSGRSIYTLLLGFGCSASAILTARNMDDKNAKIKTILVTPFLSCSARLPIYLAIAGAFFGSKSLLIIFMLYLLGILVAVLISFLLDKTILKSKAQSFILEFPPYRKISLKKALKVLWINTKSFIFRVGSVLISMNVIVWLLSNFSFTFSFVKVSGGESMLEGIARFIAPIFSPLGFSSWGLVVALLVGIVAKEGVLSTMLLLCGGTLSEGLFISGGAVSFASSSAVMAFLTFCLLYVPCLSTIAVMHKEMGGRWTLFGVGLQLAIAYVVSMMMYNLSKLCDLFGIWKVLLVGLVGLIILLSLLKVGSLIKKPKCKGCKACLNRRKSH